MDHVAEAISMKRQRIDNVMVDCFALITSVNFPELELSKVHFEIIYRPRIGGNNARHSLRYD